ncbi:CRISPR-associated helicase Cas3' [Kitasatospora sp. NPDC057015]|uniref:CRISPR-associated helicase Cas3' n=1 Tax=Kitasatospora sp. NPDC057015 TaxID=3346001 RepID=UPI0036359C98
MTFRDWFGFDPNPMQASLLKGLPRCAEPGAAGLLIIMSETGSGKTEGGLWGARWLGGPGIGVQVALPTMATTDASHRRVEAWAGRALAASSPVTLVHSQAGWNRDASRVLTHESGTDTSSSAWLEGRGRAILAGVSVSTIDQILTAVLRVRHNALRIGGLTRKVLLVDECHAYDPYMQSLLRRALAWWGAMGVPVVLMSATVPAAVARSLAVAYLSGSAPSVSVPEIEPVYPGWLYVNGRTGEATMSGRITTSRPRALDVNLVALHGSNKPERAGGIPAADEARARLVTELMRKQSGDFCTLVVCNTVRSAQHTVTALDRLLDEGVEVFLVHARYRVLDRRGHTVRVEEAFGKNRAKRPARAVLVSTQVCEQSLDLSLDHVVTDLAPIAQLIQRAGRGRRHDQGEDVRVPVSVLVPHGKDCRPDDGRWKTIYGRALMRSTRELLTGHGPIAVPGDVQKLVDAVCAGWDTDMPDRDIRAHLAGEQAMENAAKPVMIPHPRDVVDLFDLTDLSMTEEQAATRYNLDSITVLPVWELPGGGLGLESHGGLVLPEQPHADLRPIRERLLSVRREPWQRTLPTLAERLPDWAGDRRLHDVLILEHPCGQGELSVGGFTVSYDSRLGLIVQAPVAQE